MTHISVQRLRELVTLDTQTGLLYRRNGRQAGSRTSGPRNYKSIWLDGRSYLQHRVVLALHTGRWPEGDVDHINGDGADNRPINLRDCTRAQNNQNQGVSKNSSSRVTGVTQYRDGLRWRAHITVDYKQRHLGLFATKEEAANAYALAKASVHSFHPDRVLRVAQTH